MRIGSHLSIAKGLNNAARMAGEIKANTFQFFTRNPRGGWARNIPETEVKSWKKIRQQQDLYPVVGHLPYTVNLAAGREEVHRFARMVLREDLQRMDNIEAEYLVVHPGSHGGLGREKGLDKILEALEEVFLPYSGKSMLLLETMAGQGTELGTLEDLGEILNRLGNPDQLGICIDTCHLFAAGYNLREEREVDRLAEDIERYVGMNRVKTVHLNDSKMPWGSRKDRHAGIGEGYLGLEGVEVLVNHPALRDLPFLLETPVKEYKEYGIEIERVLSVRR
ncbi:deoxyribonuclease IV [Calderihabitans maritimus]|uniref:Probable endonuclease 4 n=1 Tax=Calderihabitans maritimus TaxID=1246530 RepID=A0A1Z5HQL4_9FIRM|nr:deoxyribonuclease IV [Calderihabitans maritimus]GAW91570.1 endonuclease [Calderihabitans maritimus]